MPVIITRACQLCGKPSEVTVTDEEYDRYISERFIQDALPDWSPDQREMLISGTHPECWARMFPEEDQ